MVQFVLQKEISQLDPATFSIWNVASLIIPWSFIEFTDGPKEQNPSDWDKSDHKKGYKKNKEHDCWCLLIFPIDQFCQLFNEIEGGVSCVKQLSNKYFVSANSSQKPTFFVNLEVFCLVCLISLILCAFFGLQLINWNFWLDLVNKIVEFGLNL